MSSEVKLVDPTKPTKPALPEPIQWELCVLCQTHISEPLQCPAQQLEQGKTRQSGYSSLAENLQQFNELGTLPTAIRLERIDEGQGIETALMVHRACWHKSCRLKYNNTQLHRAKKRTANVRDQATVACGGTSSVSKRTRSSSPDALKPIENVCFFCGKEPGPERLHDVTNFKTDNRVRECAASLEDTELLGRLSTGDMVALEAKYHARCLANLYNRAAKAAKTDLPGGKESETILAGIAFAELVAYIEETRETETAAPVFRLADLSRLYATRLEQLGVQIHQRIHTTRLKQRILGQFPDMRDHAQGRDTLLALDSDIGIALAKACEQNSDSDAIHLARAAQIVRKHLFNNSNHFEFDGSFSLNCQADSVPDVLLALVNMILEGPSIKEQSEDPTVQAALTMAQLLKFNSVKHARKQKDTTKAVKHGIEQETPLPIYVGMKIHVETRKRKLVDKLFHLGLSVSYDRVLQISADMGNAVNQIYHMEKVVCPPKLRSKVFTTGAGDNIDLDQSSTTATSPFHGTGISLFQHPSVLGEGIDRGKVILGGASGLKTVGPLPHYYTDVPPVTSSTKGVTIPETGLTSLTAKTEYNEYQWLKHVRKVIETEEEMNVYKDVSWSAFHYGASNNVISNLTPVP